MAVTVSGTSITFNDGTVQSTAAGIAETGSVGSYAFLVGIGYGGSVLTEGSSYAGSNLRYCGGSYTGVGSTVFGAAQGAAPAGTWRCMGRGGIGGGSSTSPMTLFLRIS